MKKAKLYIEYTFLFAIISFIVFGIFIKTGKSFIWRPDGIKQHYIILYDFNQTIRNLFKNGFSMISWNMGLGLDFIGQYSYYIIGDPFAYISLLFPLKHLNIAYNSLVIIRIYFVGLAFITYCKYNKKDDINTLIGTIIYTFCGFILYASIRHPYFTNAAILLPLNLIGIEKLLKDNKKIFFIFTIFITAICNYYFFYMITIITVIYGIIKYIVEYNNGIKDFIKKFLSVGISYVIGILMAGVILLPTIYTFLNSARTDVSIINKFDLSYYCKLLIGMVSIKYNYWSIIGVSIISIIMIPVLLNNWKQKEKKTYIIFFITTSVMLLLPVISSLMNGLSFPSNRWTFAYSFILAYIVTLCYKPKFDYTNKEKIYMFLILTIYALLGAIVTKFNIKRYIDFYLSCFIGVCIIVFIIVKHKRENEVKLFNIAILISIIINVIVISQIYYTDLGKNYIKEFVNNNEIEKNISTLNKRIMNYKDAIEYLKENDQGFYRVALSNSNFQNLSLIYDYNSIQTYLSLGNKYIYNLSSDIDDNLYSSTKCINGMDKRTKITTLLGTKYFICSLKTNQYVPYGYKLYHEINDTQIYINENYLSPGIIYNDYMLESEYKQLNSLEKEDALITTAIVKDDVENIQKLNNVKDNLGKIGNVKFKINNEDIQDNKLIVNKKNKKIDLSFESIEEDYEIYLKISNLNFKSNLKNNRYKIKVKYDNYINREETLDKFKSAYYKDNPNILMNLGTIKKRKANNLEITFCNKGTYKWDNIEILAVSMKDYEDKISKLNTMTDVKYGNNYISGNINTRDNGILQITTSYSDGWKAYVDGKEAKLLKVNEGFIGCVVESGNHNIVFKYETPYLKKGIAISIIGLISYLVLFTFEKNNVKIKE